jgi:hypothetical protein
MIKDKVEKYLFEQTDSKDIKKKLLDELWDGTKIYVISGKAVRDIVNADFVEGGHGYVYDYIPKNEIWIEEMLNKEDEKDNLNGVMKMPIKNVLT